MTRWVRAALQGGGHLPIWPGISRRAMNKWAAHWWRRDPGRQQPIEESPPPTPRLRRYAVHVQGPIIALGPIFQSERGSRSPDSHGAIAVTELPQGHQWLYELKLDGSPYTPYSSIVT